MIFMQVLMFSHKNDKEKRKIRKSFIIHSCSQQQDRIMKLQCTITSYNTVGQHQRRVISVLRRPLANVYLNGSEQSSATWRQIILLVDWWYGSSSIPKKSPELHTVLDSTLRYLVTTTMARWSRVSLLTVKWEGWARVLPWQNVNKSPGKRVNSCKTCLSSRFCEICDSSFKNWKSIEKHKEFCMTPTFVALCGSVVFSVEWLNNYASQMIFSICNAKLLTLALTLTLILNLILAHKWKIALGICNCPSTGTENFIYALHA